MVKTSRKEPSSGNSVSTRKKKMAKRGVGKVKRGVTKKDVAMAKAKKNITTTDKDIKKPEKLLKGSRKAGIIAKVQPKQATARGTAAVEKATARAQSRKVEAVVKSTKRAAVKIQRKRAKASTVTAKTQPKKRERPAVPLAVQKKKVPSVTRVQARRGADPINATESASARIRNKSSKASSGTVAKVLLKSRAANIGQQIATKRTAVVVKAKKPAAAVPKRGVHTSVNHSRSRAGKRNADMMGSSETERPNKVAKVTEKALPRAAAASNKQPPSASNKQPPSASNKQPPSASNTQPPSASNKQPPSVQVKLLARGKVPKQPLQEDFSCLYAYGKAASATKERKNRDKISGNVPWGAEEVNALQRGRIKHGNAWAIILRDPEFKDAFHPSRDDIKLKDKARNLDVVSSSTRNAAARKTKTGSAVVEGRRIKERARIQRTRKRTVRWTEEEVDLLKRGVRDFGRNWEDIWQRMPVLKDQRSVADLQVKWRQLRLHVERFAPINRSNRVL